MAKTVRVADVMTRELVTLRREQSLSSADTLMQQGRIRHLPVLDESDRLVGIISQRDLFLGALLRALGYGSFARDKALADFTAKEAMHTELVTVSPDATLAQAAQLMIERQVGCLLVVEGERLVGILTEGDFVRLALDS